MFRRALVVVVLGGCQVSIEVNPPGGGGVTTTTTAASGATGGGSTGTTAAPAGAPCGGDCTWTMEVVDDVGPITLRSGFPDFDAAIGPDGVGHVVVYADHEIRYLSSGGWAAEPLWETGLSAAHADLAIEVGSDGVVHVAAASGRYRYGRRTPEGTWQTDDFGLEDLLWSGAALALGADDLPRAFFGKTFLTSDGADWVVGPMARQMPQDAVVDGSGQVHVVWSAISGTLEHAVLVGDTWVADPIVDLDTWDASLALGSDGIGRAAFEVPDGGSYSEDVLYAESTGADWAVEEVATLGDVDRPSLALDAWDRPNVSYVDRALGDVVFAWRSDHGWVTDRVASGLAVGRAVLRLDPVTGDPVVFVEDDDSERVLMYRGH